MWPTWEATPRAPWPEGVPRGTYGPRGHATLAVCPGAYRVSKRTAQPVRNALVGGLRRVGTIRQSEHTTTEGLAQPVEAARDAVDAQAVAHLDETSWQPGTQRAWLWGAVTSVVTVCGVRVSRGGQEARELVGERCAGILVTDRSRADHW